MKTVKNRDLFFLIALSLLVMTGCADSHLASEHIYGFWGGLWHGMIAPFDFIGMLISDKIVMYADNNNGAWYAGGFLLGCGGCGLIGRKYRSK